MSNSSIIDARLMIQQANTEGAQKAFLSMKYTIESSLNLTVNFPLIKKVKADLFSLPKREIKPLNQVKISDTSSVSTIDSEGNSKENFKDIDLRKHEFLNEEEKQEIAKNIENGNKKVKSVLNKILRFEEISISKGFIKRKEELERIRKKSKKILNKVLTKIQEFRFQHGDSIALSILYLTAVEIGFTKNKYLEIVKEITSKKIINIDIVKKSKCYRMVKVLARSL